MGEKKINWLNFADTRPCKNKAARTKFFIFLTIIQLECRENASYKNTRFWCLLRINKCIFQTFATIFFSTPTTFLFNKIGRAIVYRLLQPNFPFSTKRQYSDGNFEKMEKRDLLFTESRWQKKSALQLSRCARFYIWKKFNFQARTNFKIAIPEAV